MLPDSFLENKGEIKKPGDIVPVLAALADISIEEAGQIDLDDLLGLVEKVSHFLSETQLPPVIGGGGKS